jgi:4a-hydroxytetrahydrobiopterin dehydratase
MLSEKDVTKYLSDLDSVWELKDVKIVKSFQFSSFVHAIEFVNKVAKVVDSINHLPIITINWKTVKLSLKSFDVDAITNRDINLARRRYIIVERSILICMLIYNNEFKSTHSFR